MEKEIKGEIVNLKLWSNSEGYMMPMPGEEIEQHLTLTEKHIWISRYKYGYNNEHNCFSSTNHRIPREIGKEIISKVTDCFKSGYSQIGWEDVGSWELYIINSDNEEFYFSGSLIEDPILSKLSEEIRSLLNMQELFLFDGRE